jgi:hypothetical protein
MKMADFVESLAQDAALSQDETAVLRVAGVRSFEDIHALVASFPSLGTALRIPLLSSLAAQRLGVRAQQLVTATPAQPAAVKGRGALYPPGARWPQSARVPLPPAAAAAAPPPALPPSAAIDLRVASWPVRDQGQRGTCVAFATTACVEHDDAARPPPDLSEQFLYWAIKSHTADPSPNGVGTNLVFARDALSSDGLCTEGLWPYNGTQTAVESQGGGADPSPPAIADAATRRKAGLTYQVFQGAGGAAAVLAALQAGAPVAITLPVFSDPAAPGTDNWSTSVAWLYGRVLNPPPTASVSAGHAVCILGFVPDASEPHGGFFIFRNSWNTSWASSVPAPGRSYAPERGHGDISATYIENYLWELLHF